MKKTIQRGLCLILLLGSMNGFSQETPPINPLKTARAQLIEGTKMYNPTAALATYKLYANQGNAEAMNGLGLIYSNGVGTPVNEALALEWFEKAGRNNYPKAYFNLAALYKEGVGAPKDLTKALSYYKKAADLGFNDALYELGKMYKKGMGTAQSDAQAVAYFKQGAAKGNTNCEYFLGYMIYKGLGVPQDYTAALALFQKSAKNNSEGMYMLGLCYRNGYGIEKDEQKGLEWLRKSAALGYQFAKTELEESQPENAAPNQSKTSTAAIAEVENAPIEAPKKLKRVIQKIIKGGISGLYTGTLLRYDFSGQNTISQTPIEVTFDQKQKALTGIWKEQDGDSITFSATLNEKTINFKNSIIERVEHFNHDKPKLFEFKEAQLQVIENRDDIYIVGNLQLYDIKEHENEKPMYLILNRKNNTQNVLPPDSETIVSHLVVYPNPVTTNEVNLSFNLAQQTPIKVKIYDLNGLLKYEQNLITTSIGLQEQILPFTATTGNYILNLFYGNQVLKTILIKR